MVTQGIEHGDWGPLTCQNAAAHGAVTHDTHAGGRGPAAPLSHMLAGTTVGVRSHADLAATHCTVRTDTPMVLPLPPLLPLLLLHGALQSDQLVAT